MASNGRREILSGSKKKTMDVSASDFTWDTVAVATPTPFKLNCSEDCQLWCVFHDDYLDDDGAGSSPYNFTYGDNPALLHSVSHNVLNTIDGSTIGELIAII